MTITLNTNLEAANREYTIDNPFASTVLRIRIAAQGLAETMEIIEAYSLGKLKPMTDLFGEELTPEQQMEAATVRAAEMVAILDSRIVRLA